MSTSQSLAQWAEHLATLRPWSYSVTLTYRDGLYGSQSTTERQLKEWAARVQRRYGGRFEYLAFPEHLEAGRFDHLHVLLYVSTLNRTDITSDTPIRDAIASAWRFGFTRVRTTGRTPKSKAGAARYALKDFGATTPLFASPSLARPLPPEVLRPTARRSLEEQLGAARLARQVAS